MLRIIDSYPIFMRSACDYVKVLSVERWYARNVNVTVIMTCSRYFRFKCKHPEKL